MILVIDNYDSFVHNLARYCRRLGAETEIVRNDAITVAEIRRIAPQAIILSPGPKAPAKAGVCCAIVEELHAELPILGVCLGHQCIGEVFGGRVIRAEPVHGRASRIKHNGCGLFTRLPNPFDAGRYHSLVVAPEITELEITARVADEDTIMALSHPRYPVHGVQFHPESILTDHGDVLLGNFITLARDWRARAAA